MRTIVFLLWLLSSLCAGAQDDSIRNSLGITAYRGNAFIHTPAVKYFEGSRPVGLNLEISRLNLNAAGFNRSGAFIHTGWSLGYVNFDHPALGYGLTASRFIEPQYRISPKFQLSVRGTAGIAYLSNPHDPVRNPVNRNYSQHFNPYLVLGAGMHFRLSPHFNLGAYYSFRHISNGNLKQPNLGINWVSTGLGLHYFPQPASLPRCRHSRDQRWKKEKWEKQAGIFSVPHQGYFPKWNAQRKWALGLFTQLTRKLSNTNGITAGAEIYYNRFVFDPGSEKSPSNWVPGVHAGHVFLMGKVRFSQQIGYSIFNKIRFLPDFYHRWSLEYFPTKKYFFGASLKANSDNADFFDVRFGFRW